MRVEVEAANLNKWPPFFVCANCLALATILGDYNSKCNLLLLLMKRKMCKGQAYS
jgi:hypothetical protein